MIDKELIQNFRLYLVIFFFSLSLVTISSQTYFSTTYDTDSCYNEGVIIGNYSDTSLLVSGFLNCAQTTSYSGYVAFELDLNNGREYRRQFNDRFNIAIPSAGFVEDGFLIGGTGSFVPEKGIWKVNTEGVVLDSFLFEHENPFVFNRVLANFQQDYIVSLIYNNNTNSDLIRLNSDLELVEEYPLYIIAEPGEEPNNHFEGPDGELYFTVCRENVLARCKNLELYRFSADYNHELIYSPPEEERFRSRFDGIVLPADDSSFYYLWNKDTFYYDETYEELYAEPGTVSKITYEGERLWDAIFWEHNGFISEAFTTQNGDAVLVGQAGSFYDYQPASPDDQVGGGYIARVSPTGEILWQRKIYDAVNCYNDPGTSCSSIFLNGTELPNGDLVFTGSIDTIIPGLPPANNRNTNTWVVKTDADGCLTPNCGLVQILDTTFYTSTQEWQPRKQSTAGLVVSPNPVAGGSGVRLELPAGNHLPPNGVGRLRVVNTLGVVVTTVSTTQLPYELTTTDLPAGQYILQWLSDQGGVVFTGRLIVVR